MTQQQPSVGEVEGVTRRRLGGIGPDELRGQASLPRRPTGDCQRLLVVADGRSGMERARDRDALTLTAGEFSLLATGLGRGLYRRRHRDDRDGVGQTKHNRGLGRFRRRGRSAVRTEWRLIAATHNLVKLHKHRLALAGA